MICRFGLVTGIRFAPHTSASMQEDFVSWRPDIRNTAGNGLKK